MNRTDIAEWILSLFTSPERASSIVGDWTEDSSISGWAFWWSVARTSLSLLWSDLAADPTSMALLGLKGMIMNIGLFALLLVFIIVFSSVLGFLVFEGVFGATGVSASDLRNISLGNFVMGIARLVGSIGAFLVQFQTGRWIARRAGGKEMAACVSFLIIETILMLGFGAALLNPRWMPSFDAQAGTAPMPEFIGIEVPLMNLVLTIAVFAGAIWVRSRNFISSPPASA